MCIICLKSEDLSRINLLQISCSDLEILSELPPNIKFLNIDDCENLKTITNLPPKLETFSINKCPKLVQLPILPQTLTELYVYFCKSIKNLPIFPSKLEHLHVSNCPKFTFLASDELPESLISLLCCYTPIAFFPKFPLSLENTCHIGVRLSKIPTHPTANIGHVSQCPWLDPHFPEREIRFRNLIKIQKCIKKFLARRKARIFSSLRKTLPKDICGLIISK